MLQLSLLSLAICIITISFVVLKVVGQIDWTWVQVLAPIWGTWLAGILLAVIGSTLQERADD